MHRIPQAPFRFLALVFFALVASLLVGCGGGGGNSAFTDRDGTPGPGEDPTLPLSATLVGGDTSLGQGGSTVYVVALSRAAPRDITLTVETTGAAGLEISPATIPAGARSTSFTVTADAGAAVGARQLLLVAGDDYTVGTPSSATVTVISAALADEFPEATLVGGNTSLSQGGTTSYAVTLDRAAPAEITVEVLMTGLAGLTVSPVVIPAGERSTSFTVTADVGAPVGTRQLLLVAGDEYVLGAPSSATVTVVSAALADEFPAATLVGGNTSLSQGGETSYAVVLDRPAPAEITVEVLTTGLAGLDVSPVVIPAGARSTSFTVTAGASAAEGARQLLLVAGDAYVLGTPSSATVTVGPGTVPQASLVGGDSILSPGSSTVYAVVLNQPAAAAVAVSLSVVGDLGQFVVDPTVVVIPEEGSSATFTVSAEDSAALGAEVQVSLVAGTGYTVSSPSSATARVGGGIRPVVRIEGGNRTLAPGQTTFYALVVDQEAPVETTVSLLTVGDLDQFTVPSQVVIPAGAASENFDVTASPGASESDIQIFVVSGPDYLVGTPQSVSLDVSGVGDPAVSVDSVVLLTRSPDLPSSGLDTATLTAFVRDVNNNLIEDARVVFNATRGDGTLLVTRAQTDASGTAQAELSVGNNQLNRDITVTAASGGREDQVDVQVVGTAFSLVSGRTSGSAGDELDLTIALRDSESNGIAREPVTVNAPAGSLLLSDPNPETDANGRVSIRLQLGSESGSLTLTAARPPGDGFVSGSFPINVSVDSLAFVVPEEPHEPRPEIALGDIQPLTVKWTDASTGNPIAGRNLTFTTTRGAFVGGNVMLTDVDGEATVEIEAGTAGAGPAVITATGESADGSSVTAELKVLFVATEVRSMTLQADPAVIAPNEQSTIVAVLRDSAPGDAGNRVKNKTVNFTLTDLTGGSLSSSSAISDEFGRAVVTYTAGTVSSAQNGVRIEAAVAGTTVDSSVELTVARRSLFITLGTGNVMEKPDAVRYSKPYGVLVTDSSGNPVANVDLTLEIWPTDYYKGKYVRQDRQVIAAGTLSTEFVRWVPVRGDGRDYVIDTTGSAVFPSVEPDEAVRCPNLDQDRDGISDGPVLIPGNAVTLSTLNVTTNATGFVDFDVVYFQQFAQWLDVELTARARVDGTESIDQAFFRLPILGADVTDRNVEPPGNPSPFGTGLSCP